MTTLQGNTLGEKHRNYNKLVQKSIAQNNYNVELIEIDIKQFIGIDVAAYNKDFEYILKILQSENLLYVSRALKKCPWLVIDHNYAHIVNPQYLKTQLFPLMTIKGRIQLMKFIRKHITDEDRAEQFFHNEDTEEKALKWLPKCSVPFIEKTVKQYQYYNKISPDLLKKVCERSVTILQVAISIEQLPKNKIDAVSFVRKRNIDVYLDAVSKMPAYTALHFNKNTTKLIMKHSPEKVIENFDKYVKNIHIPTFANYLKKEDVKKFIYKQASLMSDQDYYYHGRRLFTYDNLKYLIKILPEYEQFDFVKKVFIDKIHRSHEVSLPDSEITRMKKLYEAYTGEEYEWYQIAPFDVAFASIQKLINSSQLKKKYSLITILIKCARRKQKYLQILLTYYRDKHLNDGLNLKINFVNDLLTHTNFTRYDVDTWNILDDIFKSIDMYCMTDNDLVPQKFVETIIVFKLIQNQQVPEALEKKFTFNSLKKYKTGLKTDCQNRIFNYLLIHAFGRIHDLDKIDNVAQFKSVVLLLKEALQLLKDWNKNLVDYPTILENIKVLVSINIKNSWKTDLSSLYDVNKSWRKYMFEDSLRLKQSDEVAINSLKHDPNLLTRHCDIVDDMCFKNKKSIIRVLRKIRLYWSQTIAREWMDKYFTRIEDLSGLNNVTIRNLFTLMPSHQILDLVNKYVPEKEKIDWNNIDAHVVNMQKNIASNMHLARPYVSPDIILSYAKGDYLQYAIPSILAIFHNLNLAQSKQYIPKLLDAPVSLQKHGIRLAVKNLEHQDLMKIFYTAWSNSKNSTIRATLFQLTYKLLCTESCDKKIDDLWELLHMFIGVLTFQEDKKIYELLYNVCRVPLRVQPFFIETNYNFLETYLPHSGSEKGNYEWRMSDLIDASKEVMESMNEEFILKIINKYFEAVIKKEPLFTRSEERMLSITSIYLLCAKDEDTQTRKYNNLLRPLLQRFEEVENLNSLLVNLCRDLNYVIQKGMVIPVKMFMNINDQLVKKLNLFEHYVLLERWKITLEWAKIINDSLYNGRKYPDDWKQEDAKEPVELGRKVVEVLKTDLIDNLSCIYIIYDKILYSTFNNVLDSEIEMKVYKSMLCDQDFIPIYLAIARQASYSKFKDWAKTLDIINNHPSLEVKLHCNYFFKRHW